MKKLTMLLIMLIGLMFISVVSAQGVAQGISPFTAGPDCRKYGSWDATTRTCTLLADLTDTLFIQIDNATLDCAGHKLIGPGPGFGSAFSAGIFLSQRSENVLIRDCDISGYDRGIFAGGSGHIVESNNIEDYFFSGISIFDGSNIIVRNNVIDGSAVPKAAFERGIVVSSGSENQILANTIFNSVIPVTVSRSNGNIISGNTVDTGVFGIGVDGGDFTEITDNDITGQDVFAVFIAGSFNTIADNDIHESAGIRVAFFDVVGPTSNNVVEDNIIENGIGNIVCSGNPVCDSGILFTAARAQIVFGNLFGDRFMDNNTITGNTIRNFPGAGIEFDNAGTNYVVSDNVITQNGGGILLAHRCPTCEYKFMRNDIFNNGGTPLVSRDSIYNQNFVRTLLGPLAVDIVGDDGVGNPIGNYWGRECPTGPFFVAGVDSNDVSVVDSNPFGIPVAELASVPTPPGC